MKPVKRSRSKEDTLYLEKNFPVIDCPVNPCGAKILVQLRTVQEKTQGGIIIAESTKDFNNENTQLARVVKLGQIAYCNRDSGEPWREGVWAGIGDVVIVPAWGGFRFKLPIPGTNGKAVFCLFNDINVESVVEGDFETFDQIL